LLSLIALPDENISIYSLFSENSTSNPTEVATQVVVALVKMFTCLPQMEWHDMKNPFKQTQWLSFIVQEILLSNRKCLPWACKLEYFVSGRVLIRIADVKNLLFIGENCNRKLRNLFALHWFRCMCQWQQPLLIYY